MAAQLGASARPSSSQSACSGRVAAAAAPSGSTSASTSDSCGRSRTADRRELRGTLETIVDRIEQLRPPAEVEQLQRQFVAAARESIRVLGKAADDVAAGTLHCGRPLTRRISGLRSNERAEAVLRAYAKRDYTIG